MNIETLKVDIDLEEMIKPFAIVTLEHVYQEACNECAQYLEGSEGQIALFKFAAKIDEAIARMKA